jgi:hypothetical protein
MLAKAKVRNVKWNWTPDLIDLGPWMINLGSVRLGAFVQHGRLIVFGNPGRRFAAERLAVLRRLHEMGVNVIGMTSVPLFNNWAIVGEAVGKSKLKEINSALWEVTGEVYQVAGDRKWLAYRREEMRRAVAALAQPPQLPREVLEKLEAA